MLWRSKKPRGWLTPNSGPQLRIAREGAALENETPESFPAPLPLAKLWQYLPLVEVEELSLVRTYLLDIDLVVAGGYVLPDHLRNHLLGDESGGLLKVGRCRQFLGELAG